MVLDISKIIADKLAQLEESGEIKAYIEAEVEKSVKGALHSFLTGYKLQRAIEEECQNGISEIAKEMGLGAYNSLIAQVAAKVVQASVDEDAQEKIEAAIEGVLVKNRKDIKLSEIVSEWKQCIEQDDEETKRDRNEHNDGFLCELKERKPYSDETFKYYTLLLDEEGDTDTSDLEDIQIAVRFSILRMGESTKKATIKEIIFSGVKLTKEFVHHTPTRFEQLLLNLYLNKANIEMDIDAVDWDEHYYNTEDCEE